MIPRTTKHLVSSLLALMLVLSLPFMANAAQTDLDLSKTGSICVQLRDAASSATSIEGKLELYKVGNAVEQDHNLAFVPTTDFAASGISLSDVQAPELTQDLADYADQQNLTGTAVSATASSAAVFSDLTTGLYLLVQTEAAAGYLPVSPFLVSLPMYSTEGWNYQIEAAPKVQPVPKDPIELTVVKTWKDNSSTNRPTSITVNLMQDGEVADTVTLNKNNNWTYDWDDLDPDSAWTVQEIVPSGYRATYSTKGDTITITNTSDTYKEPDKLTQTGQLNWPVPILVCAGLVLIIAGFLLLRLEKAGSMRQLIGRICIFLGIVLLIAAMLLLCYNTRESQHAMEASGNVLSAIQDTREEILEEATGVSGKTQEEYPILFQEIEREMTVVEIDGHDYIGTLSIPILELELPVMAELDYPRLKISPCRQAGSVYTNDLVIAAHNYSSHFGRLYQLHSEDLLTFTDMEGDIYLYCVEAVEVLEPTAVDKVLNSPFDLVLYTCTYGGEKRVVVFCNRVLL